MKNVTMSGEDVPCRKAPNSSLGTYYPIFLYLVLLIGFAVTTVDY